MTNEKRSSKATSTTFLATWADADGHEHETTVCVRHGEAEPFCDVHDRAHGLLPNTACDVLECVPIRGYFA